MKLILNISPNCNSKINNLMANFCGYLCMGRLVGDGECKRKYTLACNIETLNNEKCAHNSNWAKTQKKHDSSLNFFRSTFISLIANFLAFSIPQAYIAINHLDHKTINRDHATMFVLSMGRNEADFNRDICRRLS